VATLKIDAVGGDKVQQHLAGWRDLDDLPQVGQGQRVDDVDGGEAAVEALGQARRALWDADRPRHQVIQHVLHHLERPAGQVGLLDAEAQLPQPDHVGRLGGVVLQIRHAQALSVAEDEVPLQVARVLAEHVDGGFTNAVARAAHLMLGNDLERY